MRETGLAQGGNVIDRTYRKAVADVTSEPLLRGQIGIVLRSGRLEHRRSKVGRIAEVLCERIVGEECPPASKPAPDPYLRAVALLSAARNEPVAPADCVAIEDSVWGLESARAAGLHTIAVAHTYPAAALGMADLVIPSIGDFLLSSLAALCAN